MDIAIHIPENCEQYAADIKRFVDAMVYKLRKNAHKGRWEDLGTDDAFQLLCNEVDELRDALRGTPNAFDVIFEGADVANFALMISSMVTEKPRSESGSRFVGFDLPASKIPSVDDNDIPF
jgi:hypothetical protein